jgi:Holliday junction resolvase RusA-like endonuclease
VTQQQQLTMFDADPAEGPLYEPHRTVRINVRGVPRPQGSIKAMPRRTRTGEFAGIATTYADTTWAWRHQVQQAVMEVHAERFDGPVRLRLMFDLPRPSVHYLPVNSKRNVPEVRPYAPAWPAVAPDLDKLVRCINDAITDAGLWCDDGQVVVIEAAKQYVYFGQQPGVVITVSTMEAR